MKITKTASGTKKITISKKEWLGIGKRAGWTKIAQEEVSIFDLVETWENEGYGIALISPEGIVIAPYINPSDYQDMMLNSNRDGAKVLSGKYAGGFIKFHSGILEERVGKAWNGDKKL